MTLPDKQEPRSRVRASAAEQKLSSSEKAQQGPRSVLSLGIGCFHFASLRSPDELSEEIYLKDLEDFLLKDRLVEDFEYEKKAYSSFYAAKKPDVINSDISDSSHIYPYINGYVVRFTIRISKRIQEEYEFLGRSLYTEKFVVEIDYSEDFPIVYIWLSDTEKNPSLAVSILWKHIKHSNKDAKYIRFQLLGPSPFHADFFVVETCDEKFDVSVKRRMGYDDVTISAPTGTSIDEIRMAIKFRLSKEFSLFYQAVIDNLHLSEKFSEIAMNVEQISEKSYIHLLFSRLIKKEMNPYYISVKLEKFLIIREQKKAAIRAQLDRTERAFENPVIKESAHDYIRRMDDIPVDSYLKIISIIREGRNHRSTIYTALISAIIAASVSLTIGLFGSNYSSQHTVEIDAQSSVDE